MNADSRSFFEQLMYKLSGRRNGNGKPTAEARSRVEAKLAERQAQLNAAMREDGAAPASFYGRSAEGVVLFSGFRDDDGKDLTKEMRKELLGSSNGADPEEHEKSTGAVAHTQDPPSPEGC